MLVLTLVRHGETKLNAAKIVQSRTPGELSPRGLKMAQRLGEKWKEEKFTRVYSSDLKRCHDTTLNILKHSNQWNNSLDIQLTELLRERDYGDLEFQPTQLVLDRVAALGCRHHEVPLPGAESYENCVNRTATFFHKMCRLADEVGDGEEERVMVISHGTYIQCMIDYILSNEDEFSVYNLRELLLKSGPPMNTSTTRMRIGKSVDNSLREISFDSLYDVSHLDNSI